MDRPADRVQRRRVILTGSNPGMRLYDADGRVVAYASIWVVDWSIRGSGSAVILWYDGQVRVVADDIDLASWLESYFVRCFLEVQGLPWPEPVIERDLVQVSMDLAEGLRAKAADIQIEMAGVLDRRAFATDTILLGDRIHSLSQVIAPVRAAQLSIAGEVISGYVHVDAGSDRPSSSAFLTTAEVWQR